MGVGYRRGVFEVYSGVVGLVFWYGMVYVCRWGVGKAWYVVHGIFVWRKGCDFLERLVCARLDGWVRDLVGSWVCAFRGWGACGMIWVGG